MKKILLSLLLLSSVGFSRAQKVAVFENAPVNASAKMANMSSDANGVIYAASGRLILKKVTLPTFKLNTKATINITVASTGDRWDKSGSCFIIPKNNGNNLMEVLQGSRPLPEATKALGNMKGHGVVEDFQPAVELMRFMTPFGVGHYSDDNLNRKPVYIPFWEKEVSWSQDISQLISLLQGQAVIGVWIDSWTAQGYKVDVSIDFEESKLACDKLIKTTVQPIFNTVYYVGEMGMPDMFAFQDVEVEFDLPKETQNAKLYYITTGHGGHSGGDEFVKQQNLVYFDNNKVIDFVPWRDDCASFRRFNPGSGVWLKKRTAPYISESGEYKTKEIEESLASSDLSRSNWCPGSDVKPEIVSLGKLAKGKHKVVLSIPKAQKNIGDQLNHWLVSAYIVY